MGSRWMVQLVQHGVQAVACLVASATEAGVTM